jgi:hypothetical protein
VLRFKSKHFTHGGHDQKLQQTSVVHRSITTVTGIVRHLSHCWWLPACVCWFPCCSRVTTTCLSCTAILGVFVTAFPFFVC